MQIRPLDYRKGHSYFSFFLFSFCSTSGKEETEFQITHRWYNFHFSSPTAEARSPSAHPRTPTLRSEGGTRESGTAAARRIPRRCAQTELRLAGARGPAAAPGSPSSAQHLARTRRGRCRCKLDLRTLGQELCSRGAPRPDPESAGRRERTETAPTPPGGSTGRAAGPAKQRTSGGTYLRLWLSGPKSTDPRRRSGGRLGLPWMARLIAVCGRSGHGVARAGDGTSGRGGEQRAGGRVCGRRRRGPVRSLPPLQPAHQFQGSCNLIPLSHRP